VEVMAALRGAMVPLLQDDLLEAVVMASVLEGT
jgi:hypothetical protein